MKLSAIFFVICTEILLRFCSKIKTEYLYKQRIKITSKFVKQIKLFFYVGTIIETIFSLFFSPYFTDQYPNAIRVSLMHVNKEASDSEARQPLSRQLVFHSYSLFINNSSLSPVIASSIIVTIQ